MKNNILLFMLPLFALISCDTTQKVVQEQAKETTNTMSKATANVEPVMITYKRGPCMGKCPVFTMEIDRSGNVSFLGSKFTKRDGEHTKKLSPAELKDLHLEVATSNFMMMDDSYDSGILDAPTITMIVESNRMKKKITFRGMMPDELKPLQAKLDAVYNSSDWTATQTKELSQTFTYSQGPCYGKCPVFTLQINDDMTANYTGKRFSEKQGEHSKTVTRQQMTELTALFEAADWFALDDKYDSNISDVATKTIDYTKGNETKRVVVRGRAPESVQSIIDYFKTFAKTEGWTQTAATDYGLPAGTIANELIVKLKKDADVKDLLTEYVKQDLKIKKNIAPTMNMYLLTFDPNTMTPQEMIESVKGQENVDTVEFNKEVSGRGK